MGISYNYKFQATLASYLIDPPPNDPFFNPVSQGFTGYAFDGYYYSAGAKQSGQASWATEGENNYRSSSISFPTPALLVLTDASLTILDASDTSLPAWMLFLISDKSVIPNNYNNSTQSFTPSGLEYSAGIISVKSSPDPGSTITSLLVSTIDFTKDQCYLMYSSS